MKKELLLLPLLALPGACATSPPATTHYLCEDGTRLDAAGGGDAITLTIDGKKYRLPRVHSGSGEKYTDRNILFWGKGDESILATSGHGMVRCHSEP